MNGLRQKYDPVSQLYCEVHISLTEPIVQKPTESDWQQFGAIVSSFKSFQIEYGLVNSFLPRPVIYLEIQPREKLAKIANALHASGWQCHLAVGRTGYWQKRKTLRRRLSDL